MDDTLHQSGIPISPSLPGVTQKPFDPGKRMSNERLLRISALCIVVAAAVSLVAKFLVILINIVTNLSFFGAVDASFHSPSQNNLGLWVILIPAIGGLIVGGMAFYGSKAIRGHGIPEAMEQILTNQSRIKPSITLLKPVSSAIAIGTGGPFGAEGPIIATGGALGSTLGQLFKITSNERKVVLAAGATAGMSAIFGTPIASIFLAIELLLFEFSPRSILPVALACITGAAGHHLLFGTGPVFPMISLELPSNGALAIYSGLGLVIGFLSLGVTRMVYIIEDAFEKLPVHWAWWPAIGGLAVGIIGYFAPHTLGVGYDNIISVLSGSVVILVVLRLFFFKLLSWAIALGSGTSGGTLAPLLTIGGAAGSLIGIIIIAVFPNAGINIPMCALVGMSALFAGASRAYLTSITFALEATGQFHALLPLLGACTAAYLVSFFLMENTIMTEKIARRGITAPDCFEPDILGKLRVKDMVTTIMSTIDPEMTIAEARQWLKSQNRKDPYHVAVDKDGNYTGIVSLADISRHDINPETRLKTILKATGLYIAYNDSLQKAMALMATEEAEVLPVVAANNIIGILSYKNMMNAYKFYREENDRAYCQISINKQRLKILAGSRRFFKPAHRY
jgi:chloride channel protein, CIC family